MRASTYSHSGLQCIKYILCGVNVLFVLTGVIVLLAATSIYTIFDGSNYFIDSSYFSPATLLIVAAVLILIISLCGFYGTLKESSCIILVFTVSLSIILLFEVSGAVVAYLYRKDIRYALDKKFWQTMTVYGNNKQAKIAIDFIQSKLHCCGINNPSDWLRILNQTLQEEQVLPVSCCIEYPGTIGIRDCNMSMGSDVYWNGCVDTIVGFIDDHLFQLESVAFGIAIVQLLAICYSIYLAVILRRDFRK